MIAGADSDLILIAVCLFCIQEMVSAGKECS